MTKPMPPDCAPPEPTPVLTSLGSAAGPGDRCDLPTPTLGPAPLLGTPCSICKQGEGTIMSLWRSGNSGCVTRMCGRCTRRCTVEDGKTVETYELPLTPETLLVHVADPLRRAVGAQLANGHALSTLWASVTTDPARGGSIAYPMVQVLPEWEACRRDVSDATRTTHSGPRDVPDLRRFCTKAPRGSIWTLVFLGGATGSMAILPFCP